MTSKHYTVGWWLAVGWLVLLVLLAVGVGILPLAYAPAVPDLQQVGLPPFSAASQHWLGTDAAGRDVLAELLFGARTAVQITLPAAVLAALLGAGLGGAAGFWGNRLPVSGPVGLLTLGVLWWGWKMPNAEIGRLLVAVGGGWLLVASFLKKPPRTWHFPLDALVQNALLLLDTVPRLVLALAVAASLGVSVSGLALLLALVAWPTSARLVRAEMRRVRALPHVAAAQALGLPAGRVWWHHALPLSCQPLRTALPLSLAGLLGLETTLAFLGVGLPPEVSSWGQLMSAVRQDLGAWWVFTFPTLALALTTLALYTLSKQLPTK